MFKNLLMVTALVSSFNVFAAAETLTVDTAVSKVVWTGKKITNSSHTGELKFTSGSLKFDKEVLTGGEFTVDMNTLTNTDVENAEYNKKLVGHLKSDDFFATEKFPTAKFVIKTAKKTTGNKYTITGDLTVKGKTAPVTFDADVTKTAATGVVKFDRTAYDVKYNSGKFFQSLGDNLINDEVELSVTLATKK